MAEPKTSRAQARIHQIDTIKATSRRLMSSKGAPALSLREVAREMGLVSSALYRYFPTRDDLLTALIVDAYNDLGATVERAVARRSHEGGRDQFHAAANAIRQWAKRSPQEYALLFGSPIPGYVAPEVTIGPATRVTGVLSRIITDSWRRKPSRRVDDLMIAGALDQRALDEYMPAVPDRVRARALIVWTQIFGFVSFELFGHYVGSVRSANRFFVIVIDEAADLVGLD